MVATFYDLNWYMDTKATNRITTNLNNLTLKIDYKSKETLDVDNGNSLKIRRIDFLTISSSFSPQPLYLKDILYIHIITKILCSISKFIEDNNIVVELYDDCCLVKDKNMRRILV